MRKEIKWLETGSPSCFITEDLSELLFHQFRTKKKVKAKFILKHKNLYIPDIVINHYSIKIDPTSANQAL